MNSVLKACMALIIRMSCLAVLLFIAQDAAAVGRMKDLSGMAISVTDTYTYIGYAITGGSYVAGLAFSIGAIMKFKQHKDNPTQIPIGTPIALVFVAAALLFLPSILSVAGFTMFGKAGDTAGPEGKTITGD